MVYRELSIIGLKDQLFWHQWIDGDKEIPKAISALRKADLLHEVLAAVEQHAQKSAPGGMLFPFNQSRGVQWSTQ